MTLGYNPSIPQPFDLPSDSQNDFESNFLRLNEIYGVDHIPFGNLIVSASLAAPIICTSPTHRLTTGDIVTVFNMQGLTEVLEPEDWPINGMNFTVTVIDENTFSLDASDSTTYPPYIENSGDFSSAAIDYGFHLQTHLNAPLLTLPNRAAPRSAYFSQLVQNVSQLIFQNGPTANDLFQLTEIEPQVQTSVGRGWRTPWGLTINMGMVVTETPGFTTYNFPLPFLTQPLGIIATRGRVRFQEGSGTKSISANILSNTQFELRYSQNSGGLGSVYAQYIAIGI